MDFSTFAFRSLLLFLGGCFLGGQINWGIYRLGWYRRRAISPWSAADPQAPPRRWTDRLPVIGWLGLRRESELHGSGFWIRPLLIELAMGIAAAGLYYAETHGRLLPQHPQLPLAESSLLHAQFAAHLLLITLMMVATFIDLDEQTIPDAITVPGVLLGLTLLTCLEGASPQTLYRSLMGPQMGLLKCTTTASWPLWWSQIEGLQVGLACYAGWCLALWPKTLTLRRGWGKGIQYCLASMTRFPQVLFHLALLLGGCGAIVWVWSLGDPYWPRLLNALCGMAFAGGMIWAVRIVAGSALGMQAMGFGDVTLMAMIGSFLGWQASVVVFGLSPFAAIFVSLLTLLAQGERRIAFGPYLCISAVALILYWDALWENWAKPIFASLGEWIPWLMLCCLALMWGLLAVMRFLRELRE